MEERHSKDEMTVEVLREMKKLDECDIQRIIDFVAGMRVNRELLERAAAV